MDANYYCDSMYSELTAMKSRLYGILRSMMQMSDADREKVSSELTEINQLADDVTHRLDTLKRECPTDWLAMKKEIDDKSHRLREKINYWDAEHIPGGYMP